MNTRFNIATDTPDLYNALLAVNTALAASGLDKRLVHLVKIRASQLNGCAFCVGKHTDEALADGVEDKVLHLLPVWRESGVFDARDKAALEWAESITLVSETGVPDEAFGAVQAQFSGEEIAQLTVAISAMNLWNRIGVSARMPA